MLGPYDITPLIAQLQADVPAFRLVAGAADFVTASKEAAPSAPACYVLLSSESAKPQSGGSRTAVQAITTRFDVVLASRSYRSAELRGQAAPQLTELVGDVRQALIGKAPPGFAPGQATAIELVSGALVGYADGVAWWKETYQTTYWSQQ